MRSNYLATELAKRHRVDLLALNQSRLLGAYYSSLEKGLQDARNALTPLFGHVEFFDLQSASDEGGKRALALKSLFSPAPYSVAWFTSPELKKAIVRRISSTDYDVVHFDTVGLAQYRQLVDGAATVLDHHNVESHMMLRRAQKESNPIKKAYFFQEALKLRAYEKKFLPRFDGHITCSDVDSQRLLDMRGGLDVKSVPNSVRVDAAFRPGEKGGDSLKLLFIGGLDWYPNRDAVLHFVSDIWPQLADAGVKLEVDIVGKNPGAELRAEAERDPRLRVHGFVDDIKAFYRDSDLFICPIRDGGGTKLKVLDAMAHGLPVIGYEEACEGIEVSNGENAAVVASPEEFAKRVLELAQDPARLTRMGENARELIRQKYEAEKVGQALSDYYVEIAQRAGVRADPPLAAAQHGVSGEY